MCSVNWRGKVIIEYSLQNPLRALFPLVLLLFSTFIPFRLLPTTEKHFFIFFHSSLFSPIPLLDPALIWHCILSGSISPMGPNLAEPTILNTQEKTHPLRSRTPRSTTPVPSSVGLEQDRPWKLGHWSHPRDLGGAVRRGHLFKALAGGEGRAGTASAGFSAAEGKPHQTLNPSLTGHLRLSL